MDSMNIVYRNPEYHLSENEVKFEVWEFLTRGAVISDACAQTIASWWHSSGSPNSTALSTMGAVTDDMSISDFVSQSEYDKSGEANQEALDALTKYISEKQKERF